MYQSLSWHFSPSWTYRFLGKERFLLLDREATSKEGDIIKIYVKSLRGNVILRRKSYKQRRLQEQRTCGRYEMPSETTRLDSAPSAANAQPLQLKVGRLNASVPYMSHRSRIFVLHRNRNMSRATRKRRG